MKQSNLSFMDGFTINPERLDYQMAFDWDKAAKAINTLRKHHSDLVAEAGLQKDWNYTGGVIFRDGINVMEPNESFYLESNWAIPTLILSWGGEEQLEIECWLKGEECRFDAHSTWDETSLDILNSEN